MKNQNDLIVPIRDRRQRKRYLTLKNFRNVMIVAVFAFIAISIRSELRGRGPADYGRILERELPVVEQKTVDVVTEAPAPPVDANSADPMLVGAMAREQWLGTDLQPMQIEEIDSPSDPWRRGRQSEGRVAIVGGPDGVQVVEQKRRQPLLSGGFGR